MTYREFQRYLSDQLSNQYDPAEADAVSNWIMYFITGSEPSEFLQKRNSVVSADEKNKGDVILSELLKGRPLQYVLQESWFDGLRLYVDENVLIPRPETEELIGWIRSDYKGKRSPSSIVDLCSGSGCIALALKKSFPSASVIGMDRSEGAVQVAKKNADQTKQDVHFFIQDVLHPDFQLIPFPDLLVSNPPYVRWSESAAMHDRVLNHEPHLALFVSDDDPLVFYRSFFKLFASAEQPFRRLYVEINESLSEKLVALASEYGLKAEVRKDLFGKDRFIRCLPGD